MTDPQTLVGQQIDEFRLEYFIDAGAMGTVFKARDTILNRIVALKLMSKNEILTPEMTEGRKRILREAQAAARLSHRNIVSVYRYGETDKYQYIAMEFVTGKTLKQVIEARGKIPVKEAIPLFDQILQALETAHAQEIIHRDIKPANIMITPDGTAKIMDFGIARMGVQSSTVTGTVLGTPMYMSPEQITGQKVDVRSDIFSVGAMLFHVLAGVKPFDADNMVGMVYQIVYTEPAAVTSDTTLPPAITRIIRKALSKDPAGRYRTSAEMREDLLAFGNVYVPECETPTVFDKKEADETILEGTAVAGQQVEKPLPKSASPPPAVEPGREAASARHEREAAPPPPELPRSPKPAAEPQPPKSGPPAAPSGSKATGAVVALGVVLLVVVLLYAFWPKPAQQAASLKVETNPSDAAISVNGEFRGRSPLLLSGIAPGKIQVQAGREGYLNSQREITVHAGESVQLGLDLKAVAPGENRDFSVQPAPTPVQLSGLEITTRPAGAKVFLNGQEAGVSPLSLKNGPTGKLALRITLDGYSDMEEEIAVSPGETRRAHYELKKREVAVIQPDATPPPRGFTPMPPASIPSAPVPPPVAPQGIPFFMVRPVTPEDLQGRSPWELDVMRNEIYARYGRTFKRKDLQDHFSRQPWYVPQYGPDGFPESLLSPIQVKNAAYIANYQKGMR